MSTILKAGNITSGGSFTPDSAGTLEIKTGTGAGTTALTLDASQNATIAGNLTLTGNASGVIKSGTAVASTSGTSIDFTGIPSTAKRVTVMLSGVSLSGAAGLVVQLGSSSGVETSGYAGDYNWIAANANSVGAFSTYFQITNTGSASSATYYGTIVFTLVSGNVWLGNGAFSRSDTTQMGSVVGGKTLAATLDRVRITTTNGTDTFDAGSINILWE